MILTIIGNPEGQVRARSALTQVEISVGEAGTAKQGTPTETDVL